MSKYQLSIHDAIRPLEGRPRLLMLGDLRKCLGQHGEEEPETVEDALQHMLQKKKSKREKRSQKKEVAANDHVELSTQEGGSPGAKILSVQSEESDPDNDDTSSPDGDKSKKGELMHEGEQRDSMMIPLRKLSISSEREEQEKQNTVAVPPVTERSSSLNSSSADETGPDSQSNSNSNSQSFGKEKNGSGGRECRSSRSSDDPFENIGIRWQPNEDEVAFDKFLQCIMAGDPSWVYDYLDDESSWEITERGTYNQDPSSSTTATSSMARQRRASSTADDSALWGSEKKVTRIDTVQINDFIEELISMVKPSRMVESMAMRCPHCTLLPTDEVPKPSPIEEQGGVLYTGVPPVNYPRLARVPRDLLKSLDEDMWRTVAFHNRTDADAHTIEQIAEKLEKRFQTNLASHVWVDVLHGINKGLTYAKINQKSQMLKVEKTVKNLLLELNGANVELNGLQKQMGELTGQTQDVLGQLVDLERKLVHKESRLKELETLNTKLEEEEAMEQVESNGVAWAYKQTMLQHSEMNRLVGMLHKQLQFRAPQQCNEVMGQFSTKVDLEKIILQYATETAEKKKPIVESGSTPQYLMEPSTSFSSSTSGNASSDAQHQSATATSTGGGASAIRSGAHPSDYIHTGATSAVQKPAFTNTSNSSSEASSAKATARQSVFGEVCPHCTMLHSFSLFCPVTGEPHQQAKLLRVNTEIKKPNGVLIAKKEVYSSSSSSAEDEDSEDLETIDGEDADGGGHSLGRRTMLVGRGGRGGKKIMNPKPPKKSGGRRVRQQHVQQTEQQDDTYGSGKGADMGKNVTYLRHIEATGSGLGQGSPGAGPMAPIAGTDAAASLCNFYSHLLKSLMRFDQNLADEIESTPNNPLASEDFIVQARILASLLERHSRQLRGEEGDFGSPSAASGFSKSSVGGIAADEEQIAILQSHVDRMKDVLKYAHIPVKELLNMASKLEKKNLDSILQIEQLRQEVKKDKQQLEARIL